MQYQSFIWKGVWAGWGGGVGSHNSGGIKGQVGFKPIHRVKQMEASVGDFC